MYKAISCILTINYPLLPFIISIFRRYIIFFLKAEYFDYHRVVFTNFFEPCKFHGIKAITSFMRQLQRYKLHCRSVHFIVNQVLQLLQRYSFSLYLRLIPFRYTSFFRSIFKNKITIVKFYLSCKNSRSNKICSLPMYVLCYCQADTNKRKTHKRSSELVKVNLFSISRCHRNLQSLYVRLFEHPLPLVTRFMYFRSFSKCFRYPKVDLFFNARLSIYFCSIK